MYYVIHMLCAMLLMYHFKFNKYPDITKLLLLLLNVIAAAATVVTAAIYIYLLKKHMIWMARRGRKMHSHISSYKQTHTYIITYINNLYRAILMKFSFFPSTISIHLSSQLFTHFRLTRFSFVFAHFLFFSSVK